MTTCLKVAEWCQVTGEIKRIEGYCLSTIGRSHEKTNTACQDYSVVHITQGFSFAAVADGVGSAIHSEIGSKIAVEVLLRHCKPILQSNDKKQLLDVLKTGFERALQEIEEIAKNHNENLKEYDTTLTAVLFNGQDVIFGHIGDGGLVGMTTDGRYSLLTSPTKGEFWNEVIPLRSSTGRSHFEIVEGEFLGVALFTDGLYDTVSPSLMLGCEPPLYNNFIKRFLSAQHIVGDVDCAVLKEEIQTMLSSKSYDSFQDDLSVCVLLNKTSEVSTPTEDYYLEPDWEKLKQERYFKLYPHLKPKADEETKHEGV